MNRSVKYRFQTEPFSFLSLPRRHQVFNHLQQVSSWSSFHLPASDVPRPPLSSSSSSSESVYCVSSCLFKTAPDRVNSFQRGMQASCTSFCGITASSLLLYICLKVIDMGLVCFLFIPTHLLPESLIPDQTLESQGGLWEIQEGR